MASPFNIGLSSVKLNDVCKIRQNQFDPIDLNLEMITANQLLIVRRHVQLFRNSTVFRRIHDKCVQKLFEADFQVDAEDDDNYSDESEDEGVEVMSPWTKLMSCTEEMFSEFDSFIERLARLETTISDIKKFLIYIFSISVLIL